MMVEWKSREEIAKMYSCCGGSGGSVWNTKNSQWDCTDCGAVKSNDPDYLYSGFKNLEKPKGTSFPIYSPKCECGSSIVGSDRHSEYCPLYKKV